MGNKFDILHEYQLAEQKCAELTNVCEKLHGTKRGSHLVAVYDAKLKNGSVPPTYQTDSLVNFIILS